MPLILTCGHAQSLSMAFSRRFTGTVRGLVYVWAACLIDEGGA